MRHAFPRGFSYDGRRARTLRRRGRQIRNANSDAVGAAAGTSDLMVTDGTENGASAKKKSKEGMETQGVSEVRNGADDTDAIITDVSDVSEQLSTLCAGSRTSRDAGRDAAFSFGRRGRRSAGFARHR